MQGLSGGRETIYQGENCFQIHTSLCDLSHSDTSTMAYPQAKISGSSLLISPQVFVETSPEVTTSKDPKSASGKSGAKVRKSAKIPPRTGSTAAPKERLLPDIIDKPSRPSVVLLQPLFKSLREACYDYMRCLYVWNYPVNDDGAVSIVSEEILAV